MPQSATNPPPTSVQQPPNELEIITEYPDCQQHSGASLTTHPFALYYEAMNADNAWQDELDRLFGKRAGDARYDGRGISTPTLAALHQDFRQKLDHWLQVMHDRR